MEGKVEMQLGRGRGGSSQGRVGAGGGLNAGPWAPLWARQSDMGLLQFMLAKSLLETQVASLWGLGLCLGKGVNICSSCRGTHRVQ